jgi:hypothetical protein
MAGFSFGHVNDFVNYTASTSGAAVSGATERALFLGEVLHTLSYDFPATGVGRARSNYLAQNRPNPFNPQTVIEYTLASRSRTTLKVYSVSGMLVRTLVDGQGEAGHNQATWDGHDNQGHAVSSGVYFVRLTTEGFADTRKMILLK